MKYCNHGLATARLPACAWVVSLAHVLLIFTVLSWSAAAQAFNSSEWPDTDFENTSIDLFEIMSGGPPKDGIPSIDNPAFVTIAQAADWLQNSEPVISVSLDGQARAYPLQILTWHEIVNDVIGDTAVTVTFCPLCNASIVFDRDLDGVRYDFGTTGRLRKSDMVMYDRQTESWWQQFVGEAIVGDLTGARLRQIPSHIVSFEKFADQYPEGQVLSRATGHQRDYGRNPYAGYDDIESSPFLFKDKIDPRLPPMERVLSVRLNDETMLFGLRDLDRAQLLETRFADQDLVVFAFETMNSALDDRLIAQSRLIPSAAVYDPAIDGQPIRFEMRDGQVFDKGTGSQWSIFGKAIRGPLTGKSLKQLDSGVHFAFAWLAFDPSAKIFKP